MTGLSIDTDGLIRRLTARAEALGKQAAARASARLAARWDGLGEIVQRDGRVRLSAPGVLRRQRGSRQALADPLLLWPGDV